MANAVPENGQFLDLFVKSVGLPRKRGSAQIGPTFGTYKAAYFAQ